MIFNLSNVSSTTASRSVILVMTMCYFMFFTEQTWASKRVTLGTSIFPPHILFDDEKGECVGVSIDVLRAILVESDTTLDVVCASPIRIYKLIESGDVDFTINVKSTNLLSPYVDFVEPPFSVLKMKLYSHGKLSQKGSIAAIRGFDYNGQRQILIKDGYEFVDLPNSITAIQLFLKNRTEHLISYVGPFEYYKEHHSLSLPADVIEKQVLNINTFIAIAKNSENNLHLQKAFEQYALYNDVELFVDQVMLHAADVN